MVKVDPLQPSGRVIAAGRLLFASLFLIAVWADPSQPTRAHTATVVLLPVYDVWSLSVTHFVWNDWWNDARLAAPAHVIDVAVFMVILYSTEGYTSPYYIFFIFVLLAAAIRWGWKETAITAAALIAVYLTVGLTLGPAEDFDVERFIIRTGHLLIISGMLVWFGANHWIVSPRFRPPDEAAEDIGGDAYVGALRSSMAALGARRGTMLWRESGDRDVSLARVSKDGASRTVASGMADLPFMPGSLLFDLRRDRVLMRADESRWRFLRAAGNWPPALQELIGEGDGLAMPFSTGNAEGIAIFQEVGALSTDHLHHGPRVAREMAARLQSAALFAAVEERSMGKARVAVARDLHDSIVQFLAGLGYRLEALIRSPAGEGALASSLTELKDMVMTEQSQLRAFIRGLRTGKPVSRSDFDRDCASLCDLLTRQWGIGCSFVSDSGPGMISLRTQLDVHQLIREAVANAVRHGRATQVRISLGAEQGEIRLTVADDGRGFAPANAADAGLPAPASLGSRVREAGGKLSVDSTAEGTSLIIHLPLEDAA